MTSLRFLTTYARLWALLPGRFPYVAVALVAGSVFGTALEVLGIATLGMLLAELGSVGGATQLGWLQGLDFLGSARNSQGLAFTLLLVCGAVFLCKNLFLAVHAWVEATFVFRLQACVSQRLVSEALDLDYEEAVKRSPSEYSALLTADLSSLVFYTLLPALTLLSELILVAAMFLYLAWAYTAVTLVVSAVLLVCGVLLVGTSRTVVSQLGVRRQSLEDARVRELQQTFGNLRDVYIYGATGFLRDGLGRKALELATVLRGYQMMATGPRFLLEFAMVAVLLTLVAVGLTTQPRGELIATLGVFAASGFRLLVGANRIIMNVQSLRFGDAALQRIWLATRPRAPVRQRAGASAAGTDAQWMELRAKGATYRHAASGAAIGPIDLHVARGEMIGIVGASGVGKSTLLELLAGLRRPAAGLLELTESGGRKFGITGPAPCIGLVGQSSAVLAGTLRENIAFGLTPGTLGDDALWEALRLAQLDDLARSLPDGLDTPLAEYGASLSGGQLQRIGIARALCRHSSFLLLDEPTSALDAGTEAELVRILRQLTDRCGIVLVSHRSAPLQQCDRVYELLPDGVRVVRGEQISLAA